MNEASYSLADIRAATEGVHDGFGYGGGSWFWIILILLFFGGNRWGNNGDNLLVSDEFIKRDIFNTNQNVSKTARQTQRDVLESKYATELSIANLAAQTQNCCCNTQKEILQSRYDNALGMQNLQAQLASCCLKIFKKVYKVVGNLISNNKLVLSH